MKTRRSYTFSKYFSTPFVESATEAIRKFTPFERLVFWILAAVLTLSTLFLLSSVNQFFLTDVPRSGGSITEGVVGSPRFINPLLAVSDADRDLTALVYSGLMRATPDGALIHDLAKRHEISDDGLSYTFTLKDDIVFHNGTPVTADDVVFTVQLIQDSALKSPKRASWEGVFVEKVDNQTVRFLLSQPYSPFLENTTLGIIPADIWRGVSPEQFPFSQFNVEPIGSGPYRVARIKRNSSGLPEFYELTSFADFALEKPFISNITIKFFANAEELIEAYQRGDVEAINSIATDAVQELGDVRIERVPLPRIFAVFFNQNQAPLFADVAVRRALDMTLDKERVVKDVLHGYGAPIYNPIPPRIISQENPEYAARTVSERLAEAKELLKRNGWEQNESGIYEKEVDDEQTVLRFSLATSNTPELKETAQVAAESWRALGAEVELQFFDIADLNQNIIRPRRYDALLFGEIIGRELDLFAFWHSSQRNDPGLNIALYANITTDKLLQDVRAESDRDARLEQFQQFEEEVRTEVPAVFVYTPDFIYIVPKNLKGLALGTITTGADRFLNVHQWFIETDREWQFFSLF